ncbi:pro-sigmaK processing inhibitor BofA family protein [Halodesulfurarchaeum sp.]|uniref:pro-sigmaK processing inhibitor BofA family protein n=1 Tax=Halodesulfurarchaeum sp. TaxID=1980530 RepID=UPI001BBD565B|nr:pro-sigmaK processing inhibitor BofA family protein [Halodesulfurarchaeum sp.]
MATPIEIGLLLLVAVAVIVAYVVLRALKPFIINAVLGLLVLAVAGFLGFEVAVSPIVVLVVAVGGIPGALLVLLLAHFGVLFAPAAAGLAFL